MIDLIKQFLKGKGTTPYCPHCETKMVNRYRTDISMKGYERWDCRSCPRLWDCDSFIVFIDTETNEAIRHIRCLPQFKLISTLIPFPKRSDLGYIKAGETEVFLHATGNPPDFIIPKAYRLDDPETIPSIVAAVQTFMIFS